MVTVDLNEAEREHVAAVLQAVLSDLSVEIANTDRMAFRDELKARREAVRKLADAVGAAGG